jgi:Carbohydrate esterase, sialic acid-specific acetylesterase
MTSKGRCNVREPGALEPAPVRSRPVRPVRSMLVAASLLAGAVVHQGAPPAGAASRDLDVLVLAGQSNALGFQSYVIDPHTHHDVFTDASRSPADRAVLLTWDESGVRASGPDPVALDTPQVRSGATSPIFGPEVGLARTLYADGHRNLLIVKVAMSGTSLARDWLPGDDDYIALLDKVASAMSWARAHGWTPTIGALYWYQGETDAMSASFAASYATNLPVFLSAVRLRLGLGTTGPVVVAQTDLSDFIRYEHTHRLCPTRSCEPEWLWNFEVMVAQERAAGPSTFVTSTSSLPRAANFIHLTDAGELNLGKTFAKLTNAHLPQDLP